MKTAPTDDTIYKEVVIIGNGPSGISLSYMLAGNLPFVVSDQHPDEMLSARLRPVLGKCLLDEDLNLLAAGLEGRSSNPLSLLMDALLHPYADMGMDLESLVEFRKAGVEIDHIVLGKGPPGGSWHKMDPQILTLSLGSWMALPEFPFKSRDSREKRAYAHDVARYYEEYVEQTNLTKYFKTNTNVTRVFSGVEKPRTKKNTWMRSISDDVIERVKVCIEPECGEIASSCFISNALNCLLSKTHRKSRCSKRPSREPICETENLPLAPKRDKVKSKSFCCDTYTPCDRKSFSESLNNVKYSSSLELNKSVPFPYRYVDSKWFVECFDTATGKKITYSCKYLVLACGASDIPNRLEIFREITDPTWLVHDLRSLEDRLDFLTEDVATVDLDPVLIVGSGLSAADAIIETRARNIPVLHVFRNKQAGLNKQLPENMYPEYHKVHQMMKDGGSTYPLYTAYPEYTLTDIDEDSHVVVLTSKMGEQVKLTVSVAAVLIGSRPDLSFLPENHALGIKKDQPVDCKTNTVDVNKLTYEVNGHENIFAMGPLAGDNFVRFIPGGALAVVSEIYRRNGYI